MFIDGMVNSTECTPRPVVVPETIDAVRQLISQDRYVTYCEIETTLGISGTSIHSILHVNEKNLFALDPTQFVNRLKKDWCRLVERNAPKIRSRCF